MKNIAVWNTAFLGDAVLTLPLLQSLRLAWPRARIDYYVRGGLSGLFTGNPAIDNVYEFRKQAEQRSLAALRAMGGEVRARGYDLWLSPHPSMRSAWMAKKSGARLSVGYTSPWYNRLFYTTTVNRRFDELHEVDRILELARPLGLKEFSRWPEIVLSEECLMDAEAFFSKLGDGPVLGIHPGSVWGTKRWPPAYFARIGRMALERGASVLVFGGPSEAGAASEILLGICEGADLQAQERVYNLVGKLSLTQFAAHIARLSCYLGNDSGPTHMAWSLHVPLVALFGPTASELGFVPLGDNTVVVELQGLACRPCSLHGPEVCPKKHHRCMLDLLPELVWPEVEKRLFAR